MACLPGAAEVPSLWPVVRGWQSREGTSSSRDVRGHRKYRLSCGGARGVASGSADRRSFLARTSLSLLCLIYSWLESFDHLLTASPVSGARFNRLAAWVMIYTPNDQRRCSTSLPSNGFLLSGFHSYRVFIRSARPDHMRPVVSPAFRQAEPIIC